MYGQKVLCNGRLLAFNGVGFFKLPRQLPALRPVTYKYVRNASTTNGLWLPKTTQVSVLTKIQFYS